MLFWRSIHNSRETCIWRNLDIQTDDLFSTPTIWWNTPWAVILHNAQGFVTLSSIGPNFTMWEMFRSRIARKLWRDYLQLCGLLISWVLRGFSFLESDAWNSCAGRRAWDIIVSWLTACAYKVLMFESLHRWGTRGSSEFLSFPYGLPPSNAGALPTCACF
jgi:hypothetical protein